MTAMFLMALLLLGADEGGSYTDPRTGQPCTPDESGVGPVWSRAEQSDRYGTVSVEFNRCPGVSSIRLLQDGEMIFRAESADAPNAGRVAFDAGRSLILPKGFQQNFPEGPVRLAGGQTYALVLGGGYFGTDFSFSQVVLAPPPDTAYLERDGDGLRVSVRPGSYSAVELREAHGAVVWRHEFPASAREVSLRLVRGDNSPATIQPEIVASPPLEAFEFEPFELSPVLWYELHATGAEDHFATFFRVP